MQNSYCHWEKKKKTCFRYLGIDLPTAATPITIARKLQKKQLIHPVTLSDFEHENIARFVPAIIEWFVPIVGFVLVICTGGFGSTESFRIIYALRQREKRITRVSGPSRVLAALKCQRAVWMPSHVVPKNAIVPHWFITSDPPIDIFRIHGRLLLKIPLPDVIPGLRGLELPIPQLI